MPIYDKAPEYAQAQIAQYAAETLENPHDREYVLSNLGNIALSMENSVSRTISVPETYKAAAGQTIRPEIGSESQVMNRSDYVSYLRSPDARGHAVARRTELLTNYDHFKEATKLPGEVLGTGGGSSVRLINVEGKQYALREPKGEDKENARGMIDTHMLVSATVEQLPDMYKQRSERLVAATYEEGGKTIAECMSGKELDKLSREEFSKIEPERAAEAVDTIAAYDAVGLGVDTSKRANFFISPEKGFGFIDLNVETASNDRVPADQSLPSLAQSVSTLFKKGAYPNSPEAFLDLADALQTTLPFLEAYKHACDILPDATLSKASKDKIAQLIIEQKQSIANYSDPEWINQQIAEQIRKRHMNDGDPDVFD